MDPVRWVIFSAGILIVVVGVLLILFRNAIGRRDAGMNPSRESIRERVTSRVTFIAARRSPAAAVGVGIRFVALGVILCLAALFGIR